MHRRAQAALAATVMAFCLAGCDDSVRRPVQVRPPAAVPAGRPAAAPQSPAAASASLPLARNRVPLVRLMPAPPSSVDLLLAYVQRTFETGEDNYKQGNLDAAREQFDTALDTLMAAGDLGRDPRLQQLFDRMVETMHTYELAAQTAEGSATEPPGEPAPIDEISDITPGAPEPGLAVKAEQELVAVPHDLPLTVNDEVLRYLSYFQTTRGRLIVATGLRRAGRYRDMIRQTLKQEGLPQDLIYLAQAESAFQPRAVSRAGARGIWQFMPFRGSEYDLDRNFWIDERSDPVASTHAAAHHLRDLYHMFGDWYLVMAAYNSGPLNVVKAVERTGYADFWELERRNALPRQTRNYVPIIIALTLVAKDPARYGVEVAPDEPPRVERFAPGHPLDLRLVSDITGTAVEDLQLLNPELLRGVTPDDASYQLRIPEGTAKLLSAGLEDIPADKWTSWRRYRVEPDDTLTEIGKKFRVTNAAILQVNHLDAPGDVTVGASLIVPAAPLPRNTLVRYRVRKGDTLESIGGEFNVTPQQIKRWNGIRGNRVRPGARLRIYAGGVLPVSETKKSHSNSRVAPVPPAAAPGSVPADPAAGKTVVHRVQPGETLWSIAQSYKTTVGALKKLNPFLSDRPLEAGDLVIVLERN